MSLQAVRPSPASSIAGPTLGLCSTYVIVDSKELPLLNVARSLRSEWLRGQVEQAYVRFTNRWKATILHGYTLGYIAFWVVLIVPARAGRWVALIASVPTTYASMVYFLLLRYEVVCLVVRTYEFWFFSVSNLLSAGLLAFYLHDLRAIIALPVWFALQNNIFVDANTVFSKFLISGSIGMLCFVVFVLAVVSLSLIDDAYTSDLLRIDANRRLTVQDALLHGFSTQAVVLARNIYRRWVTPKRPRSTPQRASTITSVTLRTSTITCVTLRARVKLRLIGQVTADDEVSVVTRTDTIVLQADGMPLVQLKRIPVAANFHADFLLVPSMGRLLFALNAAQLKAFRIVLLIIAYVGLCLSILAALSPNVPHANEIRVVAFVCSATFVGCLLMTTQRQLLRRLVFTFDFAYLSLQLIAVHGCLCDMLGWGYSSLPVLTVWLWIQWVLTTDALTPVVKAKWGMRRHLPSTIMLVFIVSQILVFVVIILEDTVELRNRVLVSLRIHGHLIETKVVPTVLSRMVLLFGWSWKVLWRMWTMQEDELLMIQGSMTYVNLYRPRKPNIASNLAGSVRVTTLTSVSPG